jgi:mannose/cellobiose epimerase-like protein (N-acyl-D-glucosamine 2-epimerase family)
VGKRHEWLAAADHICDFILPIGSDNNWQWPEALHRDGSVREGPGRIYADGFAIMGLTEYARATGSEEAIEAALATYRTVRERMTVPRTAPGCALLCADRSEMPRYFHDFFNCLP